MSACSPGGAQRNPGLTLEVIADSAPDFASLHPGYKQTRVIAPDVVGARARRTSFRPYPPKGACGTHGKKPLPRPPASQAGSPHAVREFQRHTSGGSARRVRSIELNRGLGSSFSPAFRTRMDLSACWMSPGSVAIADFPPFVRADARTFTRAVRSLCRGPAPFTSRASDPEDVRDPANFADLRVPFHAA